MCYKDFTTQDKIYALLRMLEKHYTFVEVRQLLQELINKIADDKINIKDIKQTTTSTIDGGDNILTFTLSDGSTYDYIVKNGSKGPKGDQGVKGEKGDPGERGMRGEVGPRGPQGSEGAKGEKGDKGDQGILGPVGPKGPLGLTGARGPQGEQGLRGPLGIQGPIGATGPKGPKGDKGITDKEHETIMNAAERANAVSDELVALKDNLILKKNVSVVEFDKDLDTAEYHRLNERVDKLEFNGLLLAAEDKRIIDLITKVNINLSEFLINTDAKFTNVDSTISSTKTNIEQTIKTVLTDLNNKITTTQLNMIYRKTIKTI